MHAVSLWFVLLWLYLHYNDVMTDTMTSQITSLTIVYSTVYSGADQRKHQSSASLAFVRGIHRSPMESPHKEPVTQKMFRFVDVNMTVCYSDFDFPQTPGVTVGKMVDRLGARGLCFILWAVGGSNPLKAMPNISASWVVSSYQRTVVYRISVFQLTKKIKI